MVSPSSVTGPCAEHSWGGDRVIERPTTLCAVPRRHRHHSDTGRLRFGLLGLACLAAVLGVAPVLTGVATAQGEPPESTTSTTSTTEATTSTTEPSTTTSTTEAPTTTTSPAPEPTSPPTTTPQPTTSLVVPTTAEAEVGRVVTEGTVLSPSAGQRGLNPDGGSPVPVADAGSQWFSPANQVRMAVGTLIALALLTAVLTVAYWRHTRPGIDTTDRPSTPTDPSDEPATLSAVGSANDPG